MRSIVAGCGCCSCRTGLPTSSEPMFRRRQHCHRRPAVERTAPGVLPRTRIADLRHERMMLLPKVWKVVFDDAASDAVRRELAAGGIDPDKWWDEHSRHAAQWVSAYGSATAAAAPAPGSTVALHPRAATRQADCLRVREVGPGDPSRLLSQGVRDTDGVVRRVLTSALITLSGARTGGSPAPWAGYRQPRAGDRSKAGPVAGGGRTRRAGQVVTRKVASLRAWAVVIGSSRSR